MYRDFQLYIEGAWTPASGGGLKEVVDPASEDVVGTIADATPEDLDRALAAAERGFALWRRTGSWERAALSSGFLS